MLKLLISTVGFSISYLGLVGWDSKVNGEKPSLHLSKEHRGLHNRMVGEVFAKWQSTCRESIGIESLSSVLGRGKTKRQNGTRLKT